MVWWKRLKAWQKAGIIVGGLHLIVYMAILWLLHPVAAYFLGYLEFPWVSLLMILNFSKGLGIARYLDLVIMGIAGTLIYALFAMVVGWLITTISRYMNPAK